MAGIILPDHIKRNDLKPGEGISPLPSSATCNHLQQRILRMIRISCPDAGKRAGTACPEPETGSALQHAQQSRISSNLEQIYIFEPSILVSSVIKGGKSRCQEF